MPLQATSGAASYDGFGGGVAAVPNYIEDVFSTYLYTGNGSTQTITNGIDLAGKGGLVWWKSRNNASEQDWVDTARGVNSVLRSDTTGAAQNNAVLSSFNSNGFTTGSYIAISGWNNVAWTFRKQPKFFDVVTYTGNGVEARAISHSLGSTPGCIIVKRTDNSSYNWRVWHRSTNSGTGNAFLSLNTTDAQNTAGFAVWGNGQTSTYIAPTSTNFTVSNDPSVNQSGGTYVAYIYAHDAGGFGLTGTDNVISCGSFTTDASGNATVNLGYEPQWYLVKRTDGIGAWGMADIMRGMTVQTSGNSTLFANTSGAESTTSSFPPQPNATGFSTTGLSASAPHIYIAIRRGPMKVPTSGTSVFSPLKSTTTFTAGNTTGTLLSDWMWGRARLSDPATNWFQSSRLTPLTMAFNGTTAEQATQYVGFDTQTGVKWVNTWTSTADNYGSWYFRRAPSCFDEVCYSGSGANANISHNLGVAPELMIIKRRNTTGAWIAYSQTTGNAKYLVLNTTAAANADGGIWRSTTPTSTVFYVDGTFDVNESGGTFVAYLFATCAGVSKVGSYTGNGSSQTINCGFTGGARFVLIKRTDSTGDWYVWDTARGIVTANDPHLSLNTTAAEVTTDDTIDTDSTGFVVNQVTATNVNVSSATYIYLAIA